jgi:hypothetical protein
MSPPAPVSSYLTVSPFTSTSRGRSILCCTCRHPKVPGRYPARRPMVFGLSSPIRSRRSPDTLHRKAYKIIAKNVEQTRSYLAFLLVFSCGTDEFQSVARIDQDIVSSRGTKFIGFSGRSSRPGDNDPRCLWINTRLSPDGK